MSWSWTQPCCERCWIERHAVWDEAEMDLLIGLRLPVQVIEPDLVQCAFCGSPTFIGVFVRADPASVPYPALKEDEDE